MKKIFLYIAITLGLLSCNHKDSLWQEVVEDLDERVETLEMLCAEMNTNIASLQTIVDVLQSNDFITSIVEIKKDGKVVGYTITFGKHDPITLYHGQDGKDGQNGTNGKDGQDGADGKDGITPVIGVAQDTDGVYYWTLNGEWLLDDNGNKLPVSGKDGQNGTNGSNGQDGADGKDGITPQLKIEEGYWYISYDNGVTWTQLGKATGEDGKDGTDGENGKDGQNGTDGKDGQDGDSMFQSVTQDENYVYFTLADGTVIKIAKCNGNNQSNDDFIFTITYDANGGEGVMERDTFYYGYADKISACEFEREGYFFIAWNTSPNGTGASYQPEYELTIEKNITLYAQWSDSPHYYYEYVDLGLSVKWATCNVGATKPEEYGDYFAWGEVKSKTIFDDNYSYSANPTTLPLSNDAARVNWGDRWRMPTDAEWTELCEQCTWTWTSQNGVYGYIVASKKSGYTCRFIFLPAAGYRRYSSLYDVGSEGHYWSSSLSTENPSYAWGVLFYSNYADRRLLLRDCGFSVRPVCP